MGWRTVAINKKCKLSYKNDYLLIRSEKLEMIHLSEINMIIVENGMVSITSYLINELANNKIKLIICNEKHTPSCEMVPYYGSFNTSKKVLIQSKWRKHTKDLAWQILVKYKIHNQAMLLKSLNKSDYKKLLDYEGQVQVADKTNREGHAAKVYFNALFGKGFTRTEDSPVNAALNYGYSIILSMFNREVVLNGYITQIGLFHNNMFNQFNLASDLMEPFRPIVDRKVFTLLPGKFEKEEKHSMLELVEEEVRIENRKEFLGNAIKIYTRSVFDAINDRDVSKIKFYDI